MKRQILQSLAFCGIFLGLISLARPASGAEPPPQLVIKSAEADFGTGQITIRE